MCIDIWREYHSLCLFSVGRMHQASALRTFEWKALKKKKKELSEEQAVPGWVAWLSCREAPG